MRNIGVYLKKFLDESVIDELEAEGFLRNLSGSDGKNGRGEKPLWVVNKEAFRRERGEPLG